MPEPSSDWRPEFRLELHDAGNHLRRHLLDAARGQNRRRHARRSGWADGRDGGNGLLIRDEPASPREPPTPAETTAIARAPANSALAS